MSPSFDLGVIGKSNELDGDPDRLDHMVNVLRENADAIASANSNIRKLTQTSDDIRSEAYAALAGEAREIESGMQKAVLRYQLMATAVSGFSEVLREEQAKVNQRLDSTRQARLDYGRAEADHSTARIWARSVDESTRDRGVELYYSAVQRANAAKATLSEQRRLLSSAVDRVRDANEKAAAGVERAMEQSDLDDSFWDKVVAGAKVVIDAVVKAAQWVWDNIEIISLVLDIAARFAMPIPFLGAALFTLGAVAKVLVVMKKVRATAGTVWDIVQTFASGDAAAGRGKLLYFVGGAALNLGLGKLIGKATGKLFERFDQSWAKRIYGVDEAGNLTSTKFGRMVNRQINRFGPPVTEGNLFQRLTGTGAIPMFQIAAAQERTTSMISSFLTQGRSSALLKIADGVSRGQISKFKERAKDAAMVMNGSRSYVTVGCPAPNYSLGAGGGGGGW